VVAPPAPDHAIARGRAGAGLLAHIVVSKYDDHLPLYRQAEIFARAGVSLETSTLSGWVGATAAALQPLVDALATDVLAGDTLLRAEPLGDQDLEHRVKAFALRLASRLRVQGLCKRRQTPIEQLRIEMTRYAAEMDDHVYLQRIREHIRSGRESGARHTPTFFVDGKIQDVSFGLQLLFDAVDLALRRSPREPR